MNAVNVTTTAASIASAGNCNFIHIYNNSDTTIYVAYDGAVATVAAGFPLGVGAVLQLNNDGSKSLFTRGVSAIHNGSGNKEVRVQQG